MIYGKKVSPEFRQRVEEICARLQVNPDYLMAVMAFETGETFSPSIKNKHSGATGLIQFMPATAGHLKTSTEALAAMTAEEQLHFVEKYFRPWKGRLKTLSDTYMAVLWPNGIGKPEGYVLFRSPSRAYRQNSGLDRDKKGWVTKADAARQVEIRLQRGADHAA